MTEEQMRLLLHADWPNENGHNAQAEQIRDLANTAGDQCELWGGVHCDHHNGALHDGQVETWCPACKSRNAAERAPGGDLVFRKTQYGKLDVEAVRAVLSGSVFRFNKEIHYPAPCPLDHIALYSSAPFAVASDIGVRSATPTPNLPLVALMFLAWMEGDETSACAMADLFIETRGRGE